VSEARTQRTRRPGMTDVARLAGVSHQTVSRVINDLGEVSPTTRTRVLAAMQELDYRPNRAARALVTGRTGLLGAVVLGRTYFGPASTLYALEDAALQEGFHLAVASVTTPDIAGIKSATDRLLHQGVEGLVMFAPISAGADALASLPQAPVVVVEGNGDGRFPMVNVDQYGGARAAVRHLLALGHATVWHIAGPSDWWEAERRREGWQDELRQAGIEPPPYLSGDWSAASGFDLGRVLAGNPNISAIFAGNDQMALGLLRALTESDRRVPQDVSIVGFDDIPEAAFMSPPLTTVRQEFAAVGRQAIATLVRQIRGDANRGHRTPRDVQVPARLQIRRSSAPPSPSRVATTYQ
jgi:DNA-binding LacI/PurR family transcriptional regulator